MTTSHQPGFFDAPVSANADPATSRAAEDRHTDSGRRRVHAEIVLGLVKRFPGSTAVELHAEQSRTFRPYGMLDRHEFSRRLSDLRHRGLVRQGEPRECSVRGTRMVTWLPVPQEANEPCESD